MSLCHARVDAELGRPLARVGGGRATPVEACPEGASVDPEPEATPALLCVAALGTGALCP